MFIVTALQLSAAVGDGYVSIYKTDGTVVLFNSATKFDLYASSVTRRRSSGFSRNQLCIYKSAVFSLLKLKPLPKPRTMQINIITQSAII